MDLSPLYREIQDKIRDLSDAEVDELLNFLDVEIRAREHARKYDPAKDPFLNGEGLFEGPTDLAERAEDIMYGEPEPAPKVNPKR